MTKLTDKIPLRAQARSLQATFVLPRAVRRAMAGKPIRIDGLELDLDAQLLLRLMQLEGVHSVSEGTPQEARDLLRLRRKLIIRRPVGSVQTRHVPIPRAGGTIDTRLYTPAGLAEGSGLLVYYHGGGFCVGDLDTHDQLCRFLAKTAEVRVLSVDYRLAPEDPFPAGVQDALAAFTYAARNATALGVDAERIAVGGDSAGGNLAAVTSYLSERSGAPRPAMQLLFYPAADVTIRHRSRDLFGNGFFLTDSDITWYTDNYVPDVSQRSDPRVSPALADDLSGMPPTYLATAGFDPIRDEGELLAARLVSAGVPVIARRFDGLIHGYASMFDLSPAFRDPVVEAATVLRTSLELRQRATHFDLFRPTT